MSLHVTSAVWRDSPSWGDRLLVLLALADCANDEGRCWPSQASLARRTRCSERGVQKIIDALISDKEIELVRPGGGRGKSAEYRLALYAKGEQHSPNTVPRIQFPEPHSTNGAAERANGEAGKGEQAVPPNRKEPSKNRQDIILPDWMVEMEGMPEAWEAFAIHRKRRKAPMTLRIAEGIWKRLLPRKDQSVELVEYIVERNWLTFEEDWLVGTKFSPRQHINGTNGSHLSFKEQAQQREEDLHKKTSRHGI